MKNIGTKFAAVASLVVGMLAASPAHAGKGGSAGLIRSAVQSGSVDAITAEIERAESLMCEECIGIVTNLLEDERYEVREVAAWWFAKRPALRDIMAAQFTDELATGTTIKARNAADFLGRTKYYKSLPTLRAAISRDVGVDAKVAMVRAVRFMAHKDGSPVLVTAMTDGNATVRAAAVAAWRDIRGQNSAAAVVGLLADGDATVRAEAATVVGALRETAARTQLEAIVIGDADPIARRNAAWALGRVGTAASRDALTRATADKSGLVRMVARASLASLE